jgi:hypothetical protein
MSQYGFLTVFSGILISEACKRIDYMVDVLHISDFQFYDVFYTYSQPMKVGCDSWITKASAVIGADRQVDKAIVMAYINQIRARGGRSWLYVQAVGADESTLDGFTPVDYTHKVNGVDLLNCYMPDEKWATRMCDIWVPFALYFKFDGIHWDSLGSCNGVFGDGSIFTQFLTKAHTILSQYNMLQTFNFVDSFGWNQMLINAKIIAFPYWEVWTLPLCEDYFFSQMAVLEHGNKGVFVCYSGGNKQLAQDRLNKCAFHNCKYLLFGDGDRMLVNEYFPNNISIF